MTQPRLRKGQFFANCPRCDLVYPCNMPVLNASAPDLLAALEAFTEAMDMHLGHKHEIAICKADDQARAAIAKARGTEE